MSTLKIERKENYVIVEIDNGKVNAINTALVRDLKETFTALAKEDAVKGVLLRGRPHCFSAGMDVEAMATADLAGTKELWGEYMLALQAMIRFPKPFVCAITGYAPAGATILTLCADYRIMAQGAKHRVGMHEFKMSMQIPEMLSDVYAYYLGERVAWEAVQKAKLYTSDEAIGVGLVHESVPVEEVLERAEKHLQKMVWVHGPVYSGTKSYFRKGLLKIVDRDIDAMAADVAEGAKDPFVQNSMKMFLASLKK